MTKQKNEYSKVITSCVMTFCSILAVGFLVFLCYEMHRLGDLSPVAYVAPIILGMLPTILGLYMWRAKAKSQTDLEWEKTKQLTLLRERHPEHFVQSQLSLDDTTTLTDTGGND